MPTPPAQPAPPLPHVSKKRHPFAVRGSEGAGRAGEGRGDGDATRLGGDLRPLSLLR